MGLPMPNPTVIKMAKARRFELLNPGFNQTTGFPNQPFQPLTHAFVNFGGDTKTRTWDTFLKGVTH